MPVRIDPGVRKISRDKTRGVIRIPMRKTPGWGKDFSVQLTVIQKIEQNTNNSVRME